jgi:hypothetical protein
MMWWKKGQSGLLGVAMPASDHPASPPHHANDRRFIPAPVLFFVNEQETDLLCNRPAPSSGHPPSSIFHVQFQ